MVAAVTAWRLAMSRRAYRSVGGTEWAAGAGVAAAAAEGTVGMEIGGGCGVNGAGGEPAVSAGGQLDMGGGAVWVARATSRQPGRLSRVDPSRHPWGVRSGERGRVAVAVEVGEAGDGMERGAEAVGERKEGVGRTGGEEGM